MGYFRDNIEAMTVYVPGAQPDPGQRVVKLNQNENPYPPSPRAIAALREFDGASLRIYPDPMADVFRRAVGDVLGVAPERICIGDGSDDLIMMIARAAAGPGRPIAYPTPTFPYYFTQAQVEGAEVVEIEAGADFSLPIEQLAAANAALTFLSSPNSPTGAEADMEQLDWLAGRLDGVLVIDEAYADFAASNALGLIENRPNVMILRTLSKGYSLAGLRLGFAVAGEAVGDGLLKTRAIYNVGALPAAVGAAAVSDQAYHAECVAKILAERTRLAEQLTARQFTVWPSGGNFLMAAPPSGDGKVAYDALKARGVLVRYFNKPRMLDKLRISIGTPEDNTALLAAIDEAGLGSQS